MNTNVYIQEVLLFCYEKVLDINSQLISKCTIPKIGMLCMLWCGQIPTDFTHVFGDY